MRSRKDKVRSTRAGWVWSSAANLMQNGRQAGTAVINRFRSYDRKGIIKECKKKHKAGLLLIMAAACVLFLGVNQHVVSGGSEYIVDQEAAPAADAVLVLGAYVLPDGTPSSMLYDRLTVGYELWEAGNAPKVIVSGDHGQVEYDEVNAMKAFLKDKGIPGQDVFMDHAGFSTYESLYRARDIFQADRVIIVTQQYHLQRAVFIARELGLEAYGVACDRHDYGPVMTKYRLREMLARNKDYWLAAVVKPEPTFLGDAIPVFGDGGATDDKPVL